MTKINTRHAERRTKAAKILVESTELSFERTQRLIRENWRREKEIERMIEAKVAQALRLMNCSKTEYPVMKRSDGTETPQLMATEPLIQRIQLLNFQMVALQENLEAVLQQFVFIEAALAETRSELTAAQQALERVPQISSQNASDTLNPITPR